jgi:hypothetical protein
MAAEGSGNGYDLLGQGQRGCRSFTDSVTHVPAQVAVLVAVDEPRSTATSAWWIQIDSQPDRLQTAKAQAQLPVVVFCSQQRAGISLIVY